MGFLPCPNPCSHTNPGITNQHANAYSLPRSILFSKGVCLFSPPAMAAPRSHPGVLYLVLLRHGARMRAFCCKPVGVTNAGRGVSQQVDNQPWPAARARSVRGRSRMVGHVSMYVYTHNNGLCCGLCLHLHSLAETRRTNNQHLHHYP